MICENDIYLCMYEMYVCMYVCRNLRMHPEYALECVFLCVCTHIHVDTDYKHACVCTCGFELCRREGVVSEQAHLIFALTHDGYDRINLC
jgi:hypothetical protein